MDLGNRYSGSICRSCRCSTGTTTPKHLGKTALLAFYIGEEPAREQVSLQRFAGGDCGGDRKRPDAAAVITSRHPQPRADAAFRTAIDRARTAVRERRWLSFTYARTAGGERDERAIQPSAIHAHDGRYYVWGIVESEQVPKLFAVDRMGGVPIEDDAFVPDPGLNLDDALHFSFGTMVGDGPVQNAVVRVAPEAAAFVRCRRGPAQVHIDERGDSSVALTFALTRLEEVVAWVLSFGGAATIESPHSARAALLTAAQRILQSPVAERRIAGNTRI